jgi:exodeoxyribonuclease V beta subunit
LLLWLRAVAEPLDARRVRAALATATVGLPLMELARLASDDDALEARTEQLRQLQHIWRSQGVLPLLRHSLHALQLPARWLAQPEGERKLTNFLHLAELLQAAEREREGEAALIRWLADMRAAPSGDAEGQIVRLESDADLVKVVTVHKSKGLEYPLVLLPFATHFRAESKGRGRFVTQPDDRGQPQLNLEPNADALAWAERERLREDLRLLYVALTRARHALWVGVALLGRATKNGVNLNTHHSAFGRLLLGGDVASPEKVLAALKALAGTPQDTHTELHLLASEAPFETLAPREAPPALQEAPPYPPPGSRDFDRRWGVASFSALVRALPTGPSRQAPAAQAAARSQHLADDEPAAEGSAETGRETGWAATLSAELADGLVGVGQPTPQPAATATALASSATVAPATWHSFERGALAGNFLHEQLEWLAGEGFALPAAPATSADAPASAGEDAPPHPLLARLRRRCERAGRAAQADVLLAWLQAVVHHPLPGPGQPLSQLERCLPEMEWWLPTHSLPSDELDALCRQHLLPGVDRPALPQRRPHGLVMGFADLLIQHQGRWWVLDYKSNQLGPDASAYTPPALAQAVAEHRYDVQAALYLLALHRLLAQRLGAAYQPEQHLGGALFFFLRGLDGPAGGVIHLPASPTLLSGLNAWFQPGSAEAAGGPEANPDGHADANPHATPEPEDLA